MARTTYPAHVSTRGRELATHNILATAAEVIDRRTRGAPLTPADVRALRATIRLLSSLKASGEPAVWALRLEYESVRRPAAR